MQKFVFSLPGGLHDLASVELDDGTLLQTSLIVCFEIIFSCVFCLYL